LRGALTNESLAIRAAARPAKYRRSARNSAALRFYLSRLLIL